VYLVVGLMFATLCLQFYCLKSIFNFLINMVDYFSLLDLTYFQICLFCFGMFMGGFVDASVGGGGFLIIGTLFGLAVPEHIALATNRVAVMTGGVIGFVRFRGKAIIDKNTFPLYGGIICGIFAALGAITTLNIPRGILQKITPFIMLALLIYTLINISRKMSKTHPSKISIAVFSFIAPALLGFYDGFFGPGVIVMWIIVCSYLLGFDVIKGAASAKHFVMFSGLASGAVFFLSGTIHWPTAAFATVAYLLGMETGSRAAFKLGIKFVSILLVLMLTGNTANLLYQNYIAS
jgi:uncharacterized membrane protein YfcA